MPDRQGIEQLIDARRPFELRIAIQALAEDAYLLAVEEQCNICIAAHAMCIQLVRTAQQRLSGVGELDLLQLRRDHLYGTVERKFHRLLGSHIV